MREDQIPNACRYKGSVTIKTTCMYVCMYVIEQNQFSKYNFIVINKYRHQFCVSTLIRQTPVYNSQCSPLPKVEELL